MAEKIVIKIRKKNHPDKPIALKVSTSHHKSNPIVKIHSHPFQFWVLCFYDHFLM